MIRVGIGRTRDDVVIGGVVFECYISKWSDYSSNVEVSEYVDTKKRSESWKFDGAEALFKKEVKLKECCSCFMVIFVLSWLSITIGHPLDLCQSPVNVRWSTGLIGVINPRG